jgi:hypothetical protein
MLSQWWGMMDNYSVPAVANHDVLCCASGCGPLCDMLEQWHANHGKLCCANGFE